MKSLLEANADGRLKMHFHSGQWRAWESHKRIVAVIAGARSGKTSFGALWLYREMKNKGPGDYLVAAPTLKLIQLAAGPELRQLFQVLFKVGRMRGETRFEISDEGHQKLWGCRQDRPCRIIIGHADKPDSLEALTAKAAWLDEAGQKGFKYGSWHAVQRRLAIDQGRVLITTTPYGLGWLKEEIQDKWEKAGCHHPEIDLIRFESIENPAYPREEWERAKRDLPRWKFDLFHRGIFSRPPGVIYDCFDTQLHKVPRFTVPPNWPRWLGLDFGGVHTAGVYIAEELNEHGARSGRLFAYRLYGPAGNATAKQHVADLIRGEPCLPNAVGGSKSEDQWRDEFGAAGLGVHEPAVSDVEVGIDRVYGAIARNELFVFDDLAGLLDELQSYSRELDDMGNPTRDIDAKETYHLLDALRYVVGYLKPSGGAWDAGDPPNDPGGEIIKAPPGVFLDDFPLR